MSMGFTHRIRKRLLIFLLIPLLAIIPFVVDDIVVRVISTIIIVVYVGFIIFLRDSIREEPQKFEDEYEPEFSEDDGFTIKQKNDDEESQIQSNFRTDEGEDFTIVSPNKKIEILASSNYTAGISGNKKNYFKPPDLKENYEKIANEIISEELTQEGQFGYVLEKILAVVKDAYLAHSALFFFVNKNSNRLTLEKFVSSSNEILYRKFDIENDVFGRIIDKQEPELISEILASSEKDIIRYYNTPQGVKSFVGVPLFFDNSLTGILALDSKETDVFGIETIYSLGRFVRVISLLISIYAQRFEEVRAENRLKAVLSLVAAEKKYEDEQELFQSFEHTIKHLLHWDAFAFVYYNPIDGKFKTIKIINNTTLKYVGENLELDLNDTLAGKAIITGQALKVDDTSEKEYKRYSKAEDVSFDGAFMAVPLQYDGQFYGVFCFESLKKNAFSVSDLRFMKNAVKIFSFIVYSFSTQRLLRNLLSVDIETRILSYDSFLERLYSDLLKAKELEIPGAIALIKIDDFVEQESLFEGSPFNKILVTIKDLIQEELPPINLFGRVSEKLFAVYFFNSNTKDVFLWAEKLRVKIARQPIEVSLKQTTYTVSIGVAATNNTTSVEKVLHNAELALNKALEKGGNAVKSIN